PTSLTAIPSNLESARALTLLTDRAGPGVITPNEVIIDLGKPDLALTPEVKFARQEFANLLSKDPEIFVVATDQVSPYVDPSGQYLRMFVIGQHDIGAEQSQALVHKIREEYIPRAKFPVGSKIYLGGAPAQGVDLIKTILATFPWIILLSLFLVYLILLRAFRSVILPLKAILMDLASIAVAYGSLVLVFRFGFGSSILGTYRLDQIEVWVLVFLFAVLFGLSMDYEVFIVSRMREAWNRGATNKEAIVEGLSHTGGVVSAAAIILVGALSGLVIGHFAGLQQIGIGLAFGILIDATIIRGLLLPSAMVLLGRWNWWLPKNVAQVIKTKASPLESREARL
ncbi:MAG: MMPL family transporter, partial [Acidobacteria bacterium]|nr:MMPL family transporter [Acidobacteriota bacterium]